jgi:proteasome lid subunit RPN8/RPN11
LQKFTLPGKFKQILEEHAVTCLPNESCAILYGKDDIVSDIFLTKNIEASPVNFTISNDELIQAYKTAEEKNLDVIGIFHSHPNSQAYPSNTDKKFMISNPVIWLIYSVTDKNFRAFFLDSDIIEIPFNFN